VNNVRIAFEVLNCFMRVADQTARQINGDVALWVRAADQRIAVRRCIDRIGAVADRLGHKSGLTSHPRKQTSPSPNESPLSASSGNAQSEAPSPPGWINLPFPGRSIVIFYVASHAPNLLMQLLARMLESIGDRKYEVGTPFVFRRSPLDVHFAALWKHEANVHLIKTAFAVMLTGRLYHDPASSYSTKAFVKLRYMRSYHFLDLRRPPHTLKLDFRRRFHLPYSSNCGF